MLWPQWVRLILKFAATLCGLSFFVGCASLDSSHQYLKVTTLPAGAQVYRDGQLLGVTPLLVEAKRSSHDQLTVKVNDSTQELPLASHYKWSKSFWRNFIFLGYAPVGWVVDWISGASWFYDRDIYVDFQDQLKIPSAKRKSVVAIAPPQTVHEIVADEVGGQLERALASRDPQSQVLPYQQTLQTFEDYGYDFNDPIPTGQEYDIYGKLKVDRIVSSQVNLDRDPISVDFEVRDLFRPESNSKGMLEIQAKDLQASENVSWLGSHSNILYWLPNSLFLDFANSATALTVNQQATTASASAASNDLLGQLTTVISDFSLRHIRIPPSREEWRYRFRFVPTVSFSYANETFSNIPSLTGLNFTRGHFDAGWGASFNYENPRWDFFFNFLPLAAYDSVAVSANAVNFNSSQVGLSTAAELGIMRFFRSGWTLRFFSRTATVPTNLWQQAISNVQGQSVQVQSASFQQSGLSIGYVFPNKDLPYRY